MLNEQNRTSEDIMGVRDAILAACEVYPNNEFQTWASLWLASQDRKQCSAEAIETGIRSDWFLPDPDGKQWEQYLLELQRERIPPKSFVTQL